MVTNGDKSAEKLQNYQCIYVTIQRHLSHWKKHINTKKQKNAKWLQGLQKCRKVPNFQIIFMCFCGKVYKHRQGLSRHKKTCSFSASSSDEG